MFGLLKGLSSIKTQLIIAGIVATTSFSTGFYTKSQFFKAAQSAQYQEALDQIEAFNSERRALEKKVQDAKRNRRTRTITTTRKIKILVPNNPQCDLTIESVGLLNSALGDSLSTSLGESAD